MKLVVEPRTESVVSAARYFARGRDELVYVYTALIESMSRYERGAFEVEESDLRPSALACRDLGGVWWWISDGKHGYQDYVLGFASVGDKQLLRSSYSGDHRFSELLVDYDDDGDKPVIKNNPDFDVRRWHAAMEEEREYMLHLQNDGLQHLIPHHDPKAGDGHGSYGGRWYEGGFWSKRKPVENTNPLYLAGYLDNRD